MNRRKFIKNSFVSTTSLFSMQKVLGLSSLLATSQMLSSCAAMDRYFEIEKLNYDKEVLIFGAGLSGLSAAFFLKQNNIPYKIFDASESIGGNVRSMYSQNEDVFELGQFEVDEDDLEIINMAKDLKLETQILSSSTFKDTFSFADANSITSFKKLIQSDTKSFNQWHNDILLLKDETTGIVNFESYDKFSSISFKSLLDQTHLSATLKEQLLKWCMFEFSLSSADISYLHWLILLDKKSFKSKKMKINLGAEELIYQLSQRVSGVIPNFNLQVPAKLIQIERFNDKWNCKIETKDGTKTISSPYVILAIPFHLLKNIKGFETVFADHNFVNFIKKIEANHTQRIIFTSKTQSTKLSSKIAEVFLNEFGGLRVQKQNDVYYIDIHDSETYNKIAREKNLITQLLGLKETQWSFLQPWGEGKSYTYSALKLDSKDLVQFQKSLFKKWSTSTLQISNGYMLAPANATLNDSVVAAKMATNNIINLVLER